MSDATHEVENKIATAEEKLAATLRMREEAEKALSEANASVEGCEKTLRALLDDEGNLRGVVGDLKKMREALDAVPEEGGNG